MPRIKHLARAVGVPVGPTGTTLVATILVVFDNIIDDKSRGLSLYITKSF